MADAVIAGPVAATAAAPSKRGFNTFWLVVPGVLFLAVFMIFPLGQMFSLALAEKGELTTRFLAKAMSPGLYARILGNTFSVAFQVTVLCVLLGYPMACWLVGLKGRPQRLAAFCLLLPFWTSALIKNFSWMVLLGRTGIIARAAETLHLANADSLLYKHMTVVFAMTHTMLPLAVITMLPVLQQIDRRLTLASMTLGASRGQSFWLVTLPLSVRGLSAAGLLVFVASLGFFVTPELLGGPANAMIGQMIIMQINELQNWPQGSALALVLLVSALTAVFVFDRVFGISSVAGTGETKRSSGGRMRKLGFGMVDWLGKATAVCGRWISYAAGRQILNGYALAILFILMLPIFAFVPMSFASTNYLSFPPTGFSLRWYQEFVDSHIWMAATLRSFGVGIAAAALAVSLGTLAAVGVIRGRSKLSGVVFMVLLAPLIIPPIALSISLFYLFAQIGLVATDLGIIIGHCVIALPIVFVILLASFKGYDWRLNDVAMTLGANRWQTIRSIAFPLLRGGLLAGFITGFLQSFEELTVALFVGGGLRTTLPRQMWDSILLQATPLIAAASVIVLLIVIALYGITEWLQSRQRAPVRAA